MKRPNKRIHLQFQFDKKNRKKRRRRRRKVTVRNFLWKWLFCKESKWAEWEADFVRQREKDLENLSLVCHLYLRSDFEKLLNVFEDVEKQCRNYLTLEIVNLHLYQFFFFFLIDQFNWQLESLLVVLVEDDSNVKFRFEIIKGSLLFRRWSIFRCFLSK